MRVENHEFCVGFLKDEFKEFDAVACKAVLVGNTHLFDIAVVNVFQKGSKVGSVEFEARADVGEELVVWEAFAEVVALSLEVSALVLRGDARVADLFLLRFGDAEETIEVGDVVEVLATWGLKVTKFAVIGPMSDRVWVDAILLLDFASGKEGAIHALNDVSRCFVLVCRK